MTTQTTNPADKIADQVSKQLDQMVTLSDAYRAQAEKIVDLWTTQILDAAKQGQKQTKEWVNATKAAGDVFAKAYQTQVEAAVKLFTPAS